MVYTRCTQKRRKIEGAILDSNGFWEKEKKSGNRINSGLRTKEKTLRNARFVSEASGSRTPNTQIKSLVLYQLS